MTRSDKDAGEPRARGKSVPQAATSDLAARIRRAQGVRAGGAGSSGGAPGDMTAMARGLRIGTEFVAAILVGTGIGHVLDRIAGIGPWGTLVFLMLGFAAGILNVTRVVAELNAASPPPVDPGPGPGDEDEDDAQERD